tara:strand:+ start:54 stop:287 length:234 start_codon:yes stop_codon:yes gene_type:complete
METISQKSEHSEYYMDHKEWMTQLYLEYNKIVYLQGDYSPITRTRNIKRIWYDELKKPPWLRRQHGSSNATHPVINI